LEVAAVFELKYAPPPRDLTDFVSVFYRFESDEAEMNELERADIAQLRFAWAGEGDIVFPDGKREFIPPDAIYGPRTSASRIQAAGSMRIFGIGILPAGWAALTNESAAAFANRIIPAADLLGAAASDLRSELEACSTLDAMAECATMFMRAAIEANDTVPLWFTRAVDSWLQTSLDPAFDDLIAATGQPRRKAEAMIKQLYGATPKLLARKYRALRTANLIAHGDGTWQDYAAEHYYDQSHCIRDIKEFIGITPSAIRDELSRLTTMTFSRRRLAGEIAPLSAWT
jgi:AraC-like DNA-binding protein